MIIFINNEKTKIVKEIAIIEKKLKKLKNWQNRINKFQIISFFFF